MKSSPINPLTMSFLALVLAGLGLIILSFVLPFRDYGIGRALGAGGFALLFFGIGEYLNNPPLIDHSSEQREETVQPTRKRKRTPCGLGNLFDVLAIISVFVAVSYVLFHGEQ